VATLHLPAGLIEHAGGVQVVVIDAPRVKELLDRLIARYPDLAGRLDQMAVAVDGEIHNDADYVPVRPDSEIYLVPRIAGGQ
jgi:molybdopterin synthase sulfur carrier subunit